MSEFINYIPTPQGGGVTGAGADKYHGAVASGYNAKREHDPKWLLEQNIIEDMLSDLPMGSWVLDCPCGTGRFFKFYIAKDFIFRGIDKSADMLIEALRGIIDDGQVPPEVVGALKQGQPVRIEDKVFLRTGDVRDLKLAPKSVDAAVMCRITRWLTPDECVLALRGLQKVARKRIIFTARVANHPHARTMELFESALEGWEVHRNEVGSDMDYRVVELRPIA